MSFVKEKYSQYYESISFERIGLFKLIAKKFSIKNVLYPGCSIHVTPSFSYPHVIYVDKSDLSREFFSRRTEVNELICQHKTYKQKPYVNFICQDFTEPLNLYEKSFDMLISLFSGKMLDHCIQYLKPKGYILTCSLFSDNEHMRALKNCKLICSIECHNGKYIEVEEFRVQKKKKSTFKKRSNQLVYIDREKYFIYQLSN